jgi:hypothetical protein
VLYGEFSLDNGLIWMFKVWSISRKLSMWTKLSFASMSGKIRKQISLEPTLISYTLLAWSVGARNAISAHACPLGWTTMYEPILYVDLWTWKQKSMCGIIMLICMLGLFERISVIKWLL